MFGGTIPKYIIAHFYFSMIFMAMADDAPDVKNDDKKPMLRYGFQKVNSCPDPKKSYICIMKCLELGFQIAESDKNCHCSCFKDPVKAKYFPKVSKGWTVPTTSRPAWAVPSSSQDNYVKLIGNEVVLNEEEGQNPSASASIEKEPINKNPNEVSSDDNIKTDPGVEQGESINNAEKSDSSNNEDKQSKNVPKEDVDNDSLTVKDYPPTEISEEDSDKPSLDDKDKTSTENSAESSTVSSTGTESTALDLTEVPPQQ